FLNVWKHPGQPSGCPMPCLEALWFCVEDSSVSSLLSAFSFLAFAPTTIFPKLLGSAPSESHWKTRAQKSPPSTVAILTTVSGRVLPSADLEPELFPVRIAATLHAGTSSPAFINTNPSTPTSSLCFKNPKAIRKASRKFFLLEKRHKEN